MSLDNKTKFLSVLLGIYILSLHSPLAKEGPASEIEIRQLITEFCDEANKGNWDTFKKVYLKLVSIGPLAIPYLVEELKTQKSNRPNCLLQSRLSDVIVGIGKEGVPSLLESLKKIPKPEDFKTRMSIYYVFLKIKDDRVIPYLFEVLGDPERLLEERRETPSFIGRIGGESSVDSLLNCPSFQDLALQKNILCGLAQTRCVKGWTVLLAIAKSSRYDETTRELCIREAASQGLLSGQYEYVLRELNLLLEGPDIPSNTKIEAIVPLINLVQKEGKFWKAVYENEEGQKNK